MKQRYLEKDGEFFGYIGEQIEGTEYRVGDIISYARIVGYKGTIFVSNNVLVYDSKNKTYGIMGWLNGNSFIKMISHKIDAHVSIPANLVTEEILHHLYKYKVRQAFKIKED